MSFAHSLDEAHLRPEGLWCALQHGVTMLHTLRALARMLSFVAAKNHLLE